MFACSKRAAGPRCSGMSATSKPVPSTAAIVPWAVRALRIISIGFVFYAWGMVLSNAFNGAGDTWTPTWLNLGIFWMFEIPLAWWLSRMPSVGPNGVFWAVAVAFSLYAVVSAVLFKEIMVQ